MPSKPEGPKEPKGPKDFDPKKAVAFIKQSQHGYQSYIESHHVDDKSNKAIDPTDPRTHPKLMWDVNVYTYNAQGGIAKKLTLATVDDPGLASSLHYEVVSALNDYYHSREAHDRSSDDADNPSNPSNP